MPTRGLTPWSSRRASNDLMSQFEDFISEFDRGFLPMRSSTFDFTPAIDLEEKDNQYLVTCDLPGMKKEEIKIELSDNVLSISGERNRESKAEGRYTERSYGKFMRSITLPAHVSPDKVQAHFENGVLHITLNKSESAQSRAIKIQ